MTIQGFNDFMGRISDEAMQHLSFMICGYSQVHKGAEYNSCSQLLTNLMTQCIHCIVYVKLYYYYICILCIFTEY